MMPKEALLFPFYSEIATERLKCLILRGKLQIETMKLMENYKK